jgi:glycosidase
MIRTLLLYVEKGVQVVRLDAIAYLWKEIGTSCIHLPETHRVVQLFRAVLDAVAPWVLILTETNVPHRDNVSYFGDGANEAQLVYQFSLPPLVLDAFRRADAGHLRRWASDLGAPAGNVTFFNFLASHDGVGLNPVRGILGDSEIQDLARMVESQGGTVSYRSGPSGDRPYELNISYFDAIAGAEAAAGKPVDLQVRKFLCSQAVMLAFRGVPGIYIHSMLGTRNYLEGVEATGMNRTINRRKFTLEEIRGLLDDPGSIQAQVFRGYTELLHARRSASAFHPLAAQRVLDAPLQVFALLRESRDGAERILCAFNTSEDEVRLRVAARELGIPAGLPARELAGGGALGDGPGSRWDGAQLELTLNPYGFRWLAW